MVGSFRMVPLFALAACIFFVPRISLAQEACTTYTVQEGDSLGSIAQAAYGAYDYQRIFNANRAVLAASPNYLTPGLELILPCVDGRLTPDSDPVASVTQDEVRREASQSKKGEYAPPIRVLSANGWAAFTDEGLTGGGMFPRLLATSLQRAGNDKEFTISYIDDVVSHINTLLPSGAFDVGIAWDIEDCANADLLPDLSRSLCLNFNFSDPIYEIVYGYATLADNEYVDARSYAEFSGARMCRPIGWASSDIIRNGLIEPEVTWERPEGFDDCFEILLAGQVDVYAMDVEFMTGQINGIEGGDKIVINSAMAEFMPQGFVVLKENPRGKAYLDAINAGLQEMRETGEWYAIVSGSLDEFNHRSQ